MLDLYVPEVFRPPLVKCTLCQVARDEGQVNHIAKDSRFAAEQSRMKEDEGQFSLHPILVPVLRMHSS